MATKKVRGPILPVAAEENIEREAPVAGRSNSEREDPMVTPRGELVKARTILDGYVAGGSTEQVRSMAYAARTRLVDLIAIL